jgi:hypothetical protein
VLLVFIVYSYIVGLVFHRDNRISTNPHAPLPDGYIIGSMDYHNGYIIRPGRTMNDFPKDSPDCVADVLSLQIAEPYLLGSKFKWPSTEKEYFLLDTRSGQILRFDSIEDEQSAALARGVKLNFNEFGGYSLLDAEVTNRPIWFDWFFPVASILGLGFMLISLIARGRRLQEAALLVA